MKSQTCPMEPLIEARHDGRVVGPDEASLERHLTVCEPCAKLAGDLATIRTLAQPRLTTSALEHRRRRVHLLRQAAQVGEAPVRSLSRRRLAFGLGGVTIAALASCALFMGLRAEPESRRVAETGMSEWSPETRRETSVRGVNGTEFTREPLAHGELVTFESGALEIAVKRLGAGERFVVRTRDAEVEVHGTRFRVEAHNGRLVAVLVREGRVVVTHAGETIALGLGSTWHPSIDDANPVEPSQLTEAIPQGSHPVHEPPTRRAGTPPSGVSRGPTPTSTGPSRGDDPSAAFRAAMRTMERGNYGEAAEHLMQFGEAHPTDVRAEDAAFLAVLALERAGRHGGERRCAKLLARFPRRIGARRSKPTW